MIINLRGVRESSTVFVFPTYCFIAGILALIAAGLNAALAGRPPLVSPSAVRLSWSLPILFVVVGAGIQPLHPVRYSATRRQHDDRHKGVLPEPAANLKTVQSGQHDIQDN